MVLLAKGSFIVMVIIGLTIVCISTTFAQQDAQTASPVVVSASRVPVAGGLLQIYGRNFGTDASRIKVKIVEKMDLLPSITSSSSSPGDIVACTDVKIITPDTVISCKVGHVGTGKSKHIIVSTTSNSGLISSNDDNNVAFSREAPSLQTLTYNVGEKKIVVAGTNFGYNTSVIVVALDGVVYPVLAAENSAITLRLLKRRRLDEVDYQPPTSKLVRVTVDGQNNAANMSVALATAEPVVDNDGSGGLDRNTIAGIVVGGVMGFAIISLAVALFVLKRHRKDDLKQENPPSTDNKGKPETGKVSGLENVQVGVTNEKKPPPVPTLTRTVSSSFRAAPSISSENILSASSAPTTNNSDNPILTPASNISLEEIDLHEDRNLNNLYEKNIEVLSDSSFSESSDDDMSDNEGDEDADGEGVEHTSSFSAGDFSDPSPDHTPDASPNKERRQQLQMSSEYPPGLFLERQKSLRIQEPSMHSPSPSPPALSRSGVGRPSSLRQTMVIPPPLDLDSSENSSENHSPHPSPTPSKESTTSTTKSGTRPSPSAKKGKKSKRGGMGRGMIRAPSSRLASSVSMSSVHNAFDSPQI